MSVLPHSFAFTEATIRNDIPKHCRYLLPVSIKKQLVTRYGVNEYNERIYVVLLMLVRAHDTISQCRAKPFLRAENYFIYITIISVLKNTK